MVLIPRSISCVGADPRLSTFTVVFFMNLFRPGARCELACVFAIFTSQAWNMTSACIIAAQCAQDLEEASLSFHPAAGAVLAADVPFAVPGLVEYHDVDVRRLVFVVASEAITVGNTTVTLPGIGSYVALAIQRQNLPAIGFAIVAMFFVIIAYDQLLFRPIVAWADKFRFEQTASATEPESWVLDLFRRTRALRALSIPFVALNRAVLAPHVALPKQWQHLLQRLRSSRRASPSRIVDVLWLALITVGTCGAGWMVVRYMAATLSLSDVLTAVGVGLITLLRVVVLIAGASLIWVPVGVWIGLRPKLAEKVQPLIQFLAAFPANLAFPVFVVVIVRFGLNANIWLSPLMILGTQWYILFNVIAGASAFPSDLKEAAGSFHIHGWRWWFKVILPGIFPYYVTGAITASGGSWNASIVAEVASWGDEHLTALGLGSYIAGATEAGDFPRVVLGITVMCVLVTFFNRLLWRPLYAFGERRLRLG